MIDSLLAFASKKQATDLHVCPGSKPRVRVFKQLLEMETEVISAADTYSIISGMLNEKQMKQLEENKVLDFSFSQKYGRYRANIYTLQGTYAMAIRILPTDIPAFYSLGLPHALESFTAKSRGLFLVTGAANSGKSTTMASLLDLINTRYHYHIITIEDPIEYLHENKKSLVTQRAVGDDVQNFALALRAALREDPNVIMIGEMRDAETIEMALTAAETGHLVLSSLHTGSAMQTIDRILDSFPERDQNQVRSQLASVLKGVVSQQLIQRTDEEGYVVACEVMVGTPAVQNLIREGNQHQINHVLQTGQRHGMQLIEHDLANYCLQGIINEETALQLSTNHVLLQNLLKV